MKEGQIRVVKEICNSRDCEECGEVATRKLSFLLEGARRNPASSAYRKDDCSWCSDKDMFVCEPCSKNRNQYARDLEMEWCSEFRKDRFPHMFLYWRKIEEKIEEAQEANLSTT